MQVVGQVLRCAPFLPQLQALAGFMAHLFCGLVAEALA